MSAILLLEMGSIFFHLDKSKWNDAISKFHIDAGRLDYVFDNDFGALVLEKTAEHSSSTDIKRFLLHHAFMQAEWRAQAATAGGELIARDQHVDQILKKLSNCT